MPECRQMSPAVLHADSSKKVADNDAVAEEPYNRVDMRRQEQLARVCPNNTHGLYWITLLRLCRVPAAPSMELDCWAEDDKGEARSPNPSVRASREEGQQEKTAWRNSEQVHERTVAARNVPARNSAG